MSLGKESPYIFTTFNLLNTDTMLILTLSMAPLVSIGFDQKHITLNGVICFWFDITCENFSHSAYLCYFLKSPSLPICGSIVALSQQCHITRIWAKKWHLAQIVQMSESPIHWINHYPEPDTSSTEYRFIHWKHYPPFEQLGPEIHL